MNADLSITSVLTFFLIGSFSLIAQCCRRKGKKTESGDDVNINKTTMTPSYSPILTKFQCGSEGTTKSLPASKSKSPEVLKTQTSKHTEEDKKTDSFAHHTPRVRVSKRTSEIRSKPPVCGDRDDYKTIPLQMFPSSSDDGD